MILIVDLILHRPKAYRHLLFNLLDRKTLDFDALLVKSSLIFLILDAYKLWIMSGKSQEWSLLGVGLKLLMCAVLGNAFLSVLFALSRLLDFIEGFCGYKDVLLAMIVSSYLKVYMLVMLVWEFPASVVYIIDLLVMSSNMVALKVITESPFKGCAGVCLAAHALKFFVNWMLKEL